MACVAKWVRSVVRSRDKVCRDCGHKGSKRNQLTIHHIHPRSTHPHLTNDPSNCMVLCVNCHEKRHGVVRRVS